jgi:hypothetical protein
MKGMPIRNGYYVHNFRDICARLFDMVVRKSDIIFSTDMYLENSIKSMERKHRGCSEKLIVTGETTEKPPDWKTFLSRVAILYH